MTRLYQFVRHCDVPSFIAMGWVPTDSLADCHHGRWSMLMRACACYVEAIDAR